MTTDDTPQVISVRPERDEELTAEAADVVLFDLGRPAPPGGWREDAETAKARAERESHVFTMHRPKLSIIVRLARDANPEDAMSMMGVFDDFIDSALPRPDRTYLREQLADPDSDWDYDLLLPVFDIARDRWYPDRPTGRSSGSAGPQRRSGKRSTVRSR